jgi:hypothetical protein
MEKPLSNTNFTFCDAIDSEYIIDLYAGDYIMIEETFNDVLREYDEFVNKIIVSFAEGDLSALRGAVHKMKPLFGFVGLTQQQGQCLQFENGCLAMTGGQRADAFAALEKMLLGTKSIIEEESRRLAKFNAGQA